MTARRGFSPAIVGGNIRLPSISSKPQVLMKEERRLGSKLFKSSWHFCALPALQYALNEQEALQVQIPSMHVYFNFR